MFIRSDFGKNYGLQVLAFKVYFKGLPYFYYLLKLDHVFLNQRRNEFLSQNFLKFSKNHD